MACGSEVKRLFRQCRVKSRARRADFSHREQERRGVSLAVIAIVLLELLTTTSGLTPRRSC